MGDAYERRYWYWGLVEIGKKLLLSGVMVVVFEGSWLQIAIGLLFRFLFFGGYMAFQPYEKQSDDNYQLFCQVVNFCLLLLAFLVKLTQRFSVSTASNGAIQATSDEKEVLDVILIFLVMSECIAPVIIGAGDVVQNIIRRRTS